MSNIPEVTISKYSGDDKFKRSKIVKVKRIMRITGRKEKSINRTAKAIPEHIKYNCSNLKLPLEWI